MQGKSRLQQLWLGWRKDIVRGGVLFAAVLGIGLFATRMWGRIPFNVNGFNWEDFRDHDADRSERAWDESFRWAGMVAPSHWVWIRNTNGPVQVEASESDSFIVIADKRSRRSNPDDVEIRVIEHAGSVTVCAMWRAEQMTCGSEGEYRLKDAKKNDVAVRFRILVPQGVKVDASTVNGSVEVDGAPSAVTLATVNGSIDASASGPIRAQSVNGAIHATMGELTGDEPIELKTVNGAIHAALPAKVNADLEASTVSGRINTELTVQLMGRVSPRRVNGRIGAGGRPLILSTVNGEIEITQADSDEVHQQHPKHGVRQESRVRARAPR